MAGRYKKGKKQLPTTLGQAPSPTENMVDLSHVQKPINTSIFGLKQVLTLLQTGTEEVHNYVTYECDILYECRVCRSIYRSLANFILHKRKYCREKFINQPAEVGTFVMQDNKISDESRPVTPLQEGKSPTDFAVNADVEPSVAQNKKSKMSEVVNKLLRKQELQEFTKNAINEDLSGDARSNGGEDDDVIYISEEVNVMLERINNSSVAMFQTVLDNNESGKKTGFMKSEIMEIHGILDSNEAVVGPDGKICNFQTSRLRPHLPKKEFVCSECKLGFSTKKTLTKHISYKHNVSCILYPCPDCGETFANSWGVYRHLYNVHHRTLGQVKRLRAQIHNGGIRRDKQPAKKKDKLLIDLTEDQENQWMDNFEKDKDLQMCGGCGKKFERKAALQSHSQMCTKRIAVCNSINSKSKTVENKNKTKNDKNDNVLVLTGAAKRKANLKQYFKISKSSNSEAVKLPDVEKNAKPEEVSKKIKPIDLIIENKTKKETEESKNKTEIEIKEVEPIKKLLISNEITLTKWSDVEESDSSASSPEIEIYTVTDELETKEAPPLIQVREDLQPRKSPENLETRINVLAHITAEFLEYLNDDIDEMFFSQALPFMDQTELKCKICDSEYLTPFQLLYHMSSHFSWYKYQCSKCSFMAFNKYSCRSHAHEEHHTPSDLMDATVLPIPKWKVLCMLKKLDIPEIRLEVDDPPNALEEMPTLEPMEEVEEKPQDVPLKETEEKKKEKKAPKIDMVNLRPRARSVRIKKKSIKTLQNDFIYDLGNVLKMDGYTSNYSKLKKK